MCIPGLRSSFGGIHGQGNRAGFLTMVDERRRADLGTDNRGRLAIPVPAANVVSLEEAGGVVHPFGMKLSTVVSNASNITVTAPAGTPPALSVQFDTGTLPTPGESVKTAIGAGETPYVSVFLPCTPNPTTGFYFYLPASDVIEIDMTPDDAAKLIMSAGLIQPEAKTLAKNGKGVAAAALDTANVK